MGLAGTDEELAVYAMLFVHNDKNEKGASRYELTGTFTLLVDTLRPRYLIW